MLEDLHIGTPVIGSDGQKLGTLQRIVIDQKERTVTHIVVDPGLLESGNLLAPGGWEKPRSRLLPVGAIVQVGKESLDVSTDQAAFAQAPLFEHEFYVDSDVQAGPGEAPGEKPRFRIGELLQYISPVAGIGAAPYEPATEIQFQEPGNSAEIAAGTPVWRRMPHQELGVIERVLVDPETQRVRAFVLHRKGFGGKLIRLPVEAVADVEDGIVHVTLSDAQLAQLEVYRPEE
jgi:sporulation protein YlmC with PRC-barrel domain